MGVAQEKVRNRWSEAEKEVMFPVGKLSPYQC